MFRVFQIFSEVCFICVFPDACCKCVYLDVAYVSHIFCNCFIWMLRMCCNGFLSASCVFFKCFGACFKCFIYVRTYVASIVSGCFKSRSGVASHSSPCTVSRLGVFSSSSVTSHPSQTGEGARRGMAVRTRANALPFH